MLPKEARFHFVDDEEILRMPWRFRPAFQEFARRDNFDPDEVRPFPTVDEIRADYLRAR
jgi:hypothetical protein